MSEFNPNEEACQEKTPAQLKEGLEEKRKRLQLPKRPYKYLLFDKLCANIVDFDEDGSPYLIFTMVDESEADRLPIECGICPAIMHQDELKEHLNSHKKPNEKRFICFYCDKDFCTSTYAAVHARKHYGIRPYGCVLCDLYCYTKQEVKLHQKKQHLDNKFICEYCGKLFAVESMLNSHRKYSHELKHIWKCEVCGQGFLRKCHMKEHLRCSRDGEGRLFKCIFCDVQFEDPYKLIAHRKIKHVWKKLFKCPPCRRKFKRIAKFYAHRRSFKCCERLKKVVDY